MVSMLTEQLSYRMKYINQMREYANQVAICNHDGLTIRYIASILMHEDFLENEYKYYVDN